MKKKKYWIQKIYAVIAPDGSALDYLYIKSEAKIICDKANKEIKE